MAASRKQEKQHIPKVNVPLSNTAAVKNNYYKFVEIIKN